MENKNKNFTLLILGFMTFLANGDNFATATLISSISKDLGLSISAAAISVTSYMMAFGLFTILFGPLADRFGKVRIINIAAIGTAIFSMLGALAFNLPSLIFFRTMNGIFGAGIIPVTLALVGELYDEKHRQKALGKVLGITFLGGAMATAIGGTISYFGSWRLVYLIYGIGEFLLAIIIMKVLKKDQPVVKKLQIFSSYKKAFENKSFIQITSVVFLSGFTVLGSFTYAGISIMEKTGYNIFIVGLVLSFFGIGTVVGGRFVQSLRKNLKKNFLIVSGIIGFISLNIMALSSNIFIIGIGLFGFGLAYMLIHSTLVATAQEKLPKMKGTVMSLVSLNLFLGAAVGTQVNGYFMEIYSTSAIFSLVSFVMLGMGILSSVLVLKYEKQKRKIAFDNLNI